MFTYCEILSDVWREKTTKSAFRDYFSLSETLSDKLPYCLKDAIAQTLVQQYFLGEFRLHRFVYGMEAPGACE